MPKKSTRKPKSKTSKASSPGKRTKKVATARGLDFLRSTHIAVRTHMQAASDLPTFLGSAGVLTLNGRKRIVEQALVLIDDNFVHLPLKQAMHGVQAADVYFKQGKRGSIIKLLISPTATVFKHLVLGSAWLDGWQGWIAAFGSGLHATTKHMRLLELTRNSKS